jgi:hypothetical protein
MVFRRKAARRTRSFGRMKARSHSRSSGGVGLTDLLIGGAIYGVGRGYVANMLPTLFSFGPVDSDNAIIAGAGYLGLKSSNKIIKATSMMAIGGETAIVASRLANGNTTDGGNSSGSAW